MSKRLEHKHKLATKKRKEAERELGRLLKRYCDLGNQVTEAKTKAVKATLAEEKAFQQLQEQQLRSLHITPLVPERLR